MYTNRAPSFVAVLVLASFCTVGCKSLKPNNGPTLTRFVDPAGDTVKYAASEFTADVASYRAAIKSRDIEGASLIRDTMIQRVRLEIDSNYHQFEKKLFENRAYFSTAADWVELGLAGATAAVGGEAAKTVLGVVLTAAKGARLSLDKNFFREKTSETIISAMQSERLKRLTLITSKMTSGDAAQYSWDEAWVDLLDYFYAGTLESALISIAAQTSSEASAAKGENRQVEKDRAKAFSLQKATRADILTVRQITRLFGELSAEKATQILDELHIEHKQDDNALALLRAKIDSLQPNDSEEIARVATAFQHVLGK